MLQIKKTTSLLTCKYNLQFLFRKKKINKLYSVRKQLTSTILLRSPKHFNIGKQKIINLNYKTPTLFIPVLAPLHLGSFLHKGGTLFNILLGRIKHNPALNIGSIRLRVKAQFKLKWLEIWY